MNNRWRNKLQAALLERDPVLQPLRIAEAFEAIVERIEELEELGNAAGSESRKLGDALEQLKRIRDLRLDRSA